MPQSTDSGTDASIDAATADILQMMGGEDGEPKKKPANANPNPENPDPANPNPDDPNPDDPPEDDGEYVTLPPGYTVDDEGNVFDPEGNEVLRDENGELKLPPDNPDEGKKYEVKVGDQTVEVTLDELKAGYMKDADYRRKTAEVAEQRKAVEAKSSALNQAESLQGQLIGAYASLTLLQQQLQAYDQVDWATLENTNLNEFVRHRETRRDLIDAHNQLVAGIQQFQNQRASQTQQETVKQLSEQAEILKRDIKGFDAPKARALMQFAQESYGFSPEELGQLMDARQVKVLYEAYQYRQLQKGKQDKVKRVRDLPQKNVTPGSSQQVSRKDQNRAQLVQKAKRTGSVNDAAAALMHLIPDDF